MKVLLISNYLPDNQQSMLRFARMMETGLRSRGYDVRVSQARPVLRRRGLSGKLAKWLGYLDKYVVYPPQLKREAEWADIIHVCDHSNGVYLPALASKPRLVTIHDLLAVRGALGENTLCPASLTGKFLQRAILKGLKTTDKAVCDSTATKEDAARLLGRNPDSLKVIPLGLDECFHQLDDAEIAKRLTAAGCENLLSQPFVLAVGTGELRKNRHGTIRIFSLIKDKFPGILLFVGSPLDESCRKLVSELALGDRVLQLAPDNHLLAALYNRAHALLAASVHEGFGWPPFEAQRCGCPVVASTCGPFREYLADSAPLHDVTNEQAFAESLLELMDEQKRQLWVERSLGNALRFTQQRMIDEYLSVYASLR